MLPGTSRLLADRVLKLPGETIDIKTMGQANKEKPAPVSHTVTSDWVLHGGGGGEEGVRVPKPEVHPLNFGTGSY